MVSDLRGLANSLCVLMLTFRTDYPYSWIHQVMFGPTRKDDHKTVHGWFFHERTEKVVYVE